MRFFQKTCITLVLLVLTADIANAQYAIELNGVTTTKIKADFGGDIPANEKVKLVRFEPNAFDGVAVVVWKDQEFKLTSAFSTIRFEVTSLEDFWKYEIIKTKSYLPVLKYGKRYDIRNELEQESLEFLENYASHDLFFNDAYMEGHIQNILNKIVPRSLGELHTGTLYARIINDPIPNAFVLGNGTVMVSTGLLSMMNSDAELEAVLAHEVAHYIHDHAVANVFAAKKREQRALFWATMATVAVGIVDYQTNGYNGGEATLATAVLAYTMAGVLTERMGLAYSRDQERESDASASAYLTYIKAEPGALSSVLQKIQSYLTLTGNAHALSGEGSHPSLDERIATIGTPVMLVDTMYDRRISLINSHNAVVEFALQHFDQAARLAERNIEAGVGIEDDYILLARVIRIKDSSRPSLEKAYKLLQTAKTLNVLPKFTLYKDEALLLIDMKNEVAAKKSFEEYRVALLNERKQLENKESAYFRYIEGELDWTQQMVRKVGVLAR